MFVHHGLLSDFKFGCGSCKLSTLYFSCFRVQGLSAIHKDTIKFINLLPGSRLINHLIYQPSEVS